MKKYLIFGFVILIIVVGFLYYKNNESLTSYSDLGISFKYPETLGEVVDGEGNAYFTNIFEFTGETVSPKTVLGIYTDESVKNWDNSITEVLESGESIGDSMSLGHSLNVKSLLNNKEVGYGCTQDFAPDLNLENNDSCEVISISGVPAFKIISDGGHQSEVSLVKYLFYQNDRWYDFSRRFSLNSYSSGTAEKLYDYNELKSLIRGEELNNEIKQAVEDFEKIVSSIKFN